MATITPKQAVGTGTDPGLQAANSGGDSVEAKRGDYTVFVILENTSTNSETVTFASAASNLPPGVTASDLQVSVPAGEVRVVAIPQDEESEIVDNNALANLTYSNASAINVGAFLRKP